MLEGRLDPTLPTSQLSFMQIIPNRSPTMIGYITLGTSDIARGAAFYDAIAKEMDTPRMIGWRRQIDDIDFQGTETQGVSALHCNRFTGPIMDISCLGEAGG